MAIVMHTIKHKAMHPITGPRIIKSQCFDDEQWNTECLRSAGRVLQGEIVARSPEGNHPVQDIAAAGILLAINENANAALWNAAVHDPRQP